MSQQANQPPPTPFVYGPGANITSEPPVTPTPGMEAIHANQQGSQSSYFPSVDSGPAARARAAQTPGTAQAANNALQQQNATVDSDPKAAYPNLSLTGAVISATFCVPYALDWNGSDWNMKQRRGTSALFDSLSYLSSNDTPWNHTMVGWTGEIAESDPAEETATPPETTVKVTPLNKSSAPIPIEPEVDVTKKDKQDQPQGLKLSKEDRAKLERALAHDDRGRTVPVWLNDEGDYNGEGDLTLKDQSRWRRFAEHELFPLFHYKQHSPTDGRAEKKAWADYQRMNEKFAARILEIYKPGDIVMIHDYHLLLVPGLLRAKIPHMYISFFLHVPFPSSEFLRCLPRRNEVLEGMLGANLVGFQSFSYSRHFVSCCTRILGYPSDISGVEAYGSKITVGVFPIGIDAQRIEKLAFGSAKIDQTVESLKKLYAGKKIIVGRDRLDSVRGVVQKLMAFERFLEDHPNWREKVVLIQVTSPAAVEEEKEKDDNKIATKVSELVAKINGTYGSLGFSPVQHYPQYLSQDEYLALLRAADVGLITSVRDGMNTTSLEYVVCQRDNHGPVILSEFSGTAGSLKEAIHINPWDLSGVAAAITEALEMPNGEKERIHSDLYKHVTQHNVQSWTSGYIKRLLSVLQTRKSAIHTPLLDRKRAMEQYNKAKKRLFMFDYDGTLTPIVKDPAAAKPSPILLETLVKLANDERNAVWIISGRDQEFLNETLGHIHGLGFSAEHGAFMKYPGSDKWENLAETTDMSWQKEVMDVFEKYTERTQGSFIERKRCALTWHYRRADQELATYMARECQMELEQDVAKRHDVEVMTGKMNLEVRPTFINKGEIVKKLIAAYMTQPAAGEGTIGEVPEFLICLGDDFTDEDMFRALNGSGLPEETIFAVTVGASTRMTLAKWHLPEAQDVVYSMAGIAGLVPIDGPLPGPGARKMSVGKL